MALGITVSIIVCSLLLVILVLSLVTRHFAERDKKILSELAEKFGGSISTDSFNAAAILAFTHKGITINFFQKKGMGGKINRCCLKCDINYSTPLAMHIAKGISGETTIAEVKDMMFMPRSTVGSDKFKKVFSVRGNNPSFISALVASEFEKQLLSFSSSDPVVFLHPKKAVVSRLKGDVSPGHSLEFSIAQTPRAKEEVEKTINDCLSVVRRFLSSAGV